MKDLTKEEALAEARTRWGASGAVRARPGGVARGGSGRGRLARYRYTVGNGGLGRACSIEGQGDTWRSALADARPLARRSETA